MLSDAEVLECIQRGLDLYATDDATLRESEWRETPSDNAAAFLTLVDGTEFIITVTKIAEGE